MAQGTTRGVPIDTDPLLAADSDLLVASQKATKAYADTKQSALGFTPENVANKQNSLALDGTGAKYPTVDAINAGLLRSQLIAKLNGSAQLATTVINTNFFIVSVPIPPNTFIAGDMLLVHSRNYKSGSVNTSSTFSLAIGTVNNNTSGVVIGIMQSGANISRHLLPIDRRFSVTNSTTIYGYRPDFALSNDGISSQSGSNFPQSITGLDFTQTQYLKVLVQTTALNVLTENISLEIWRLR
jgi:hypothetical protein